MVVSYDELVPLAAQAEMATAAAAASAREGEGEWKEARRDILAAVRAAVAEDGACPEGEGAARHFEKIVAALKNGGGGDRNGM